ncbi:MAG: dCTP deaminase domain-containing protein [Neptuniibacter sp.]
MILSDKEIKELVDKEGLIKDFSEEGLEGASYDMRLGAQYSRNNSTEILDEGRSVVIAPGEFMLLSSLEKVYLPKTLIGHNGIMSRWAKKGLVSLFSPQIDPGFHGMLIVPVFNAGGSPVSITLGDAFFTVEFAKCHEASYAWSDKHGEQNAIVSPDGPEIVGPSFEAVSKLQDKLEVMSEKIGELTEKLITISAKVDTHLDDKRFSFTKRGLALTIISIIIATSSLSILAITNYDKISTSINGSTEATLDKGSQK